MINIYSLLSYLRFFYCGHNYNVWSFFFTITIERTRLLYYLGCRVRPAAVPVAGSFSQSLGSLAGSNCDTAGPDTARHGGVKREED